MTKRQIRQQRKEAAERDWRSDRDEDLEQADVPTDEYPGMDEFARLAQEFRG